MHEQRKQILEMLAEGKITADDAERLINALENSENTITEECGEPSRVKRPKFLHVKVSEGQGRHENVDIKIPIMLLKAGIKIGSLMPEKAKGKFSSHLNNKGINFDLNSLDSNEIDTLIMALSESSIDIDSDKEKVKIFCA